MLDDVRDRWTETSENPDRPPLNTYFSLSQRSWSTLTGLLSVLPLTLTVTRYVPGSTAGAPPPRPPPKPPPAAAPFAARFHRTRLTPASLVPSMLRMTFPVASAIEILTSPDAAFLR